MKRFFTLTTFLLLAISSFAYSAYIDGIYYNFSGTEATVTYYKHNDYTGAIVIPASVTFNKKTYSVTRIGYNAFEDCSGLTSVAIPNSVTSIGWSAFRGCSGLTSVTIPNSVTSIESAVFSECSSLTSVTIPNSVISIENETFYNCSSLTSVTIPNSVTTIANRVFYGCISLTSVTIPNSVTSIGDEVFKGCSGLTSLTIGNSVTSIGNWAFDGCSALTSVTIPNGVTTIGVGVFGGCSSLNSITIPNSVTSISGEAFKGCSGLTSVTIPNSVTSIGRRAFKGCSGLTSATIPNSVTSIEEGAFDGCSSLTSMEIPNSVKSIGDNVFYCCNGLTSVTIPNSVTTIGNYAFADCSSLSSVTIPNSVTTIGKRAFWNCHSLTSVTIPNSVATIKEGAFESCAGLTSVTIGNGVANFETWVFGYCSSITEIISLMKEPSTTVGCWYDVVRDIPLYVPTGTKNLYATTEGWSDFTNIIECGLAPVERDESVTYVDNAEINGNTDLGGVVIGDIYYNIPISTGGYDAANGCITVETAIADEQVADIAGKDVYDADVAANFNGIVFLLPAGSGTLTVNAETVGNMMLKIKAGDNEPITKQLNGKQEVTIPYNTPVSTYVYIYAGQSAGTKGVRQAAANNALRIYGIALNKYEATGIKDITADEGRHTTRTAQGIYTLQGVKVSDDADALKQLPRGIYIVNERKVAVK